MDLYQSETMAFKPVWNGRCQAAGVGDDTAMLQRVWVVTPALIAT